MLMGLYYVARLLFPGYTTQLMRAEMTAAQAKDIKRRMEKHKKAGVIRDFDLHRPDQREWVHAMVFTPEALLIELEDMVATEVRLSREDR